MLRTVAVHEYSKPWTISLLNDFFFMAKYEKYKMWEKSNFICVHFKYTSIVCMLYTHTHNEKDVNKEWNSFKKDEKTLLSIENYCIVRRKIAMNVFVTEKWIILLDIKILSISSFFAFLRIECEFHFFVLVHACMHACSCSSSNAEHTHSINAYHIISWS